MENILLEFTLDTELERGFKEFLLNETNNNRINPVLSKKIVKLIDNGYIVFGYKHSAFMRMLFKLKDTVQSIFTTNINKHTKPIVLGYYEYKSNRIYILSDIKEYIPSPYLHANILNTVLHEIIHLSYVSNMKKFDEKTNSIAREFYFQLVRNFNLWYPIEVDAKNMSYLLNDLVSMTVRDIIKKRKTNIEFVKIAERILSKWRLDEEEKTRLIEWVDFTYNHVIFGDETRLQYSTKYIYSFVNAYSTLFKPDAHYMQSELSSIYFYQEFLNKSEIFALVSSGLYGQHIGRNTMLLESLVLIA